jgi:hypothetical protein
MLRSVLHSAELGGISITVLDDERNETEKAPDAHEDAPSQTTTQSTVDDQTNTRVADPVTAPAVDTTASVNDRVEVILKKDHTDSGIEYKAGDKLVTDRGTAEWLREHKIID